MELQMERQITKMKTQEDELKRWIALLAAEGEIWILHGGKKI